jgi:hypothetical protein
MKYLPHALHILARRCPCHVCARESQQHEGVTVAQPRAVHHRETPAPVTTKVGRVAPCPAVVSILNIS